MAGSTKAKRLFQVKEPFSATVDGVAVTMNVGDLVEEGDPILTKRRNLFEPHEPKIRNYSGKVEQATINPGEQRDR